MLEKERSKGREDGVLGRRGYSLRIQSLVHPGCPATAATNRQTLTSQRSRSHSVTRELNRVHRGSGDGVERAAWQPQAGGVGRCFTAETSTGHSCDTHTGLCGGLSSGHFGLLCSVRAPRVGALRGPGGHTWHF